MTDITPQEARRIVRDKLSGDWTDQIPALEYEIAPGGWAWSGLYVFNDGPSDPEEFEVPEGMGLAAVEIATGKAERLGSSQTFQVLTEGKALTE